MTKLTLNLPDNIKQKLVSKIKKKTKVKTPPPKPVSRKSIYKKVIAILQKNHPEIFPQKRIMLIDVKTIFAELKEFYKNTLSAKQIRTCLNFYTNRTKYLEGYKINRKKYSLYGKVINLVTQEEKEKATKLLKQIKKVLNRQAPKKNS